MPEDGSGLSSQSPMPIPTEPIGSIPRPIALIDAVAREGADHASLQPLYEEAIRNTIERFEGNGLSGDLRRRAKEVSQFLDVLRPWPACGTAAEPVQSKAGTFYVALAGERDPERVLRIIGANVKADQRVFVGVIAPIDPRVETAEAVRDRILQAAKYIPIDQLGTTDDCGFSPFSDDTSTSRDTTFAKIRARVVGTSLAAQVLGVR